MDIAATFLKLVGVSGGNVVIVEDEDLGVDSVLGLVDGVVEGGEKFVTVDKVVDFSRQRDRKPDQVERLFDVSSLDVGRFEQNPLFKDTVAEEAGTAPPHRNSFARAADRIADDGFDSAMKKHLGDNLRRHVGGGLRNPVVPELGIWKGAGGKA